MNEVNLFQRRFRDSLLYPLSERLSKEELNLVFAKREDGSSLFHYLLTHQLNGYALTDEEFVEESKQREMALSILEIIDDIGVRPIYQFDDDDLDEKTLSGHTSFRSLRLAG